MAHEVTFHDVGRVCVAEDTRVAFVMDEDSFRVFYDRTARGLWAYLSRVTGDPQLADDLLQESFYRFLRAAAIYESEAHRRNSLYRIATNLARDSRRRNVNRPPVGATGDEVGSLAGTDKAGAAERTAGVQQAMAKLKPREREVLWLAYAEGATHEEIASALGLRAGSMKVLLFRARRKMAALLGAARGGWKR